MNITPLYDRVVLKRVEAAETVKGGIIIPDTAKEKPMEAEVVAVGEGKFDDNGKREPCADRKIQRYRSPGQRYRPRHRARGRNPGHRQLNQRINRR